MRPSLKAAIEWVALNDDPSEMDQEVVIETITVGMLADLYGKTTSEISRRIVKIRREENAREPTAAQTQAFLAKYGAPEI